MNWEIDKVCRICLEEGAQTSVFSGNFTLLLSEMIEKCTEIKVLSNDGLPTRICNNCIYKLGIAYHFKQQAINSDLRLRHHLGLPTYNWKKDAMVMTDASQPSIPTPVFYKCVKCKAPEGRKSVRSKRKPENEKLKRGPKPKNKPPETCCQCGRDFKCKAQLEIHMRTHSGEKPFRCKVCRRGFTQKHNLEIHMRLHSGEKPYQCELCSKRFSAQGNLQTHLKIHNNQRDQICAVCKKGFVTSSELNRHMARHTGAKDYKCDLCQSAFVQNRDLKHHKWKKHNISNPSIAKNTHTIPSSFEPIQHEPNMLLQTHQDVNIDVVQDNLLVENNLHKCSACGESFPYLALLARHCTLKHSPYINVMHP